MRFGIAFFVLFPSVLAFAAGGVPSSAEFCGGCHRSIHDGWKKSAHALAAESRLFQDALALAGSEYGASSRKLCLGCHSPTLRQTGDYEMKNKVSWEGVTCDYCHSIRGISDTGRNISAIVKYTDVKSGPYKNAVSTAHGTEYSEVHVSSKACASCHEYRNALGMKVLSTYSEWRNSPAARDGKQCQDCHMFRVKGDVVDPHVQRTRDTQINLHEMPGGHSLEQLNKALRGRLEIKRDGDQLEVDVTLTNRMGGHAIPTGSPLRQIAMQLRVDPHRGKDLSEVRFYRRVVADSHGKVLHREHSVWIAGAEVLEDTRIEPDETRRESFSFPVPADVPATVEASLWYYYSPVNGAQSKKTKFHTMSRFVP